MYMSSQTEQPKDIYTVWNQSVAKFFDEVEKSTSKYRQSVAALQQEYLEAWKNVINSAIALEKEYAVKAGLNADVPEATLKTAREITEKAIKAYQIQSKITADSTDIAKKAFQAFNDNTKSFVSLNKEIMDSMMSVIQKQKT